MTCVADCDSRPRKQEHCLTMDLVPAWSGESRVGERQRRLRMEEETEMGRTQAGHREE